MVIGRAFSNFLAETVIDVPFPSEIFQTAAVWHWNLWQYSPSRFESWRKDRVFRIVAVSVAIDKNVTVLHMATPHAQYLSSGLEFIITQAGIELLYGMENILSEGPAWIVTCGRVWVREARGCNTRAKSWTNQACGNAS